MTFTPKFVDLVRNLTSVTGTGAVTLGSAVSGYAGIAQALSAGDQFYYCIQSVDKPQEREVGRGTLQADGRVAREPIAGPPTSFTGGTKTIALVAAAEWFSKLENGGAAAKSLFVTPQDFGAKGDGATDDTAAFKQAIDFLDQNAAGYTGAARLYVPKGIYRLSDTLNIRAMMIIEGDGPMTSLLRWSAGKSGIRIGRVNTADATTGSVAAFSVGGGDQATIRMLGLEGGYAGTEGEFHGIELRARANLADLNIGKWQGDGIYSDAAAGGGASEGNSSCAQLNRVVSVSNRNGLYVNGPDANVWQVAGCDFRSNRQWGVWDSSFLGNVYIGCHTAANGWDGALGSVPTGCTHLGNRYYVKAGQAAGASANAPSGTAADNEWWGYSGPGGIYNGVVPWTAGTVFREGGSYKTDDPSARNCFFGCYSEGDQNAAQIEPPSLIIGGFLTTPSGAGMLGVGAPGTIRLAGLDVTGGAAIGGALTASGNIHDVGPQAGPALNTVVSVHATGDYAALSMYSHNGGLFKVVDWGCQRGVGSFVDLSATAGATHRLLFNGGGVTTLRSGGIDIDGSQVLSARGAAVADATDNASAITQLNVLLSRLRVHGLIAT